METHKLLDRFELLYPLNSKLADLRRAFIDKDLHSVFRLITDNNKEDLRKIILEDNKWSLWKILDSMLQTRLIQSLKSFEINKLDIDEDCLSQGQIKSKLWLLKELQNTKLDLGTVFICAGWYGTLATMLFESKINIDKIRSFDIDNSCKKIAEIFNKPWVIEDWKFKPVTQDIHDINFDSHTYTVTRNDSTECSMTDSPDTIINTSCEHIDNFTEWYAKIPKGKLVVLQNNNFFELNEHVNCVNDLDDFACQTPLSKILYEGELKLEKYTRYMRIGVK
tara:strand:- start:31696 stop:32532 length:837 start_codon:yes stop_codon:yes gene_type:complete